MKIEKGVGDMGGEGEGAGGKVELTIMPYILLTYIYTCIYIHTHVSSTSTFSQYIGILMWSMRVRAISITLQWTKISTPMETAGCFATKMVYNYNRLSLHIALCSMGLQPASPNTDPSPRATLPSFSSSIGWMPWKTFTPPPTDVSSCYSKWCTELHHSWWWWSNPDVSIKTYQSIDLLQDFSHQQSSRVI